MTERRSLRVAVAMDKFKGTLTAREAVEAVADCIEAEWPEAVPLRVPLADGGEGTASVIGDLLGLKRGYVPGHDAFGRSIGEVEYRYGDGCVVADVASVLSLDHLAPEERDVFRASSAAAGELVAEIMERHPGVPLWLGVGGTATCDAGIPAAQRLIALSRRGGFPVSPIMLLCDVQVPLLGDTSGPGETSAMSFVEQKGCPAERRDEMRNRLRDAIRTLDPGGVQLPGDGAGGGIPFAFRRMLGAVVTDGATFVLDRAGLFADPLPDVIITGEGSLDEQSVMGKLTGRIAREGRLRAIPVIALCGRVDSGFAATVAAASFTHVISTEDFALPEEALSPAVAKRRLIAATRRLLKIVKA